MSNDVERIVADIAYNYTTAFIGEHMKHIVRLWDSSVTVSDIQPRNPRNVTPHSLVPSGRSEDDVHWKYYDRQSKKHDPCNYGMQKHSSQQFCQTHALRMAIDPSTRKATTTAAAYLSLLPIFDRILTTYEMDRIIRTDAIVNGIKGENHAYAQAAQAYYGAIPDADFHSAIYEILNGEYAKATFPGLL